MFKKQNRLAGALSFLFLVSIFLFTTASSCGGPQTGKNWTPSQAYLNAMSTLYTQRAETYSRTQKLWNLCNGHYFQNGYSIYYTNGASYYTQYVAGNFNAWLERLATEAESGANVDLSDDQGVLREALQANYSFSTWVDQVDNYFRNSSSSISQGGGGLAVLRPNGGLPPELIEAVAPAVVDGVFSLLKSVASDIGQEVQNNAQADQQMQAKVAQQLKSHEWDPYMNNCPYL